MPPNDLVTELQTGERELPMHEEPKLRELIIEVTLDGESVYRKYNIDSDYLEAQTLGGQVIDMIDTLNQ